jgi:GNAT superfamily N-acetyltransferase
MDEFIVRCRQWMVPRLVDESRWSAWLAERGGQPIGNVWVQIVEKIPNPGPESEVHAYVSNFFVTPAERNAGAGTALLNAVIAHCRSRQVDTVFLWPTERSMPLYRRSGFAVPEDLLVLELRGTKPNG